MSPTATHHPPTDVRQGAFAPLSIRVLSAPGEERRVELPSGSTTIGAGPRCSLRLQSPGMRPLHCVITNGPHGAVVRRWSSQTRLNGETFTESPLGAGDQLSIAGVELIFESESQAESSLWETQDAVSPEPEATQSAAPQPTPRSEEKEGNRAPLSPVPSMLLQSWQGAQDATPAPAENADPLASSAAVAKRLESRRAARARIGRLVDALREQRRTALESAERLQRLELDHEALTRSLDVAQSAIDSESSRVRGLEHELEGLRDELRTAEEEAFRLRGAALVADSRTLELQEEIDRLQNQLAEREEQQRNLAEPEGAPGAERREADTDPFVEATDCRAEEPSVEEPSDWGAESASLLDSKGPAEEADELDPAPINPAPIEAAPVESATLETPVAESPWDDLWSSEPVIAAEEPGDETHEAPPAGCSQLWDIEASPAPTAPGDQGDAAQDEIDNQSADAWLAQFEKSNADIRLHSTDQADASPAETLEREVDQTEAPLSQDPLEGPVEVEPPSEQSYPLAGIEPSDEAGLEGASLLGPTAEPEAAAPEVTELEATELEATELEATAPEALTPLPLAEAPPSAEGLIAQQQPTSAAPESFIDKYADLLPADPETGGAAEGLGSAFDREAESMEAPGPEYPSQDEPSVASSSQSPAPEVSGSMLGEQGSPDDSIEDYMAGLMQRIRGESEATSPTPESGPEATYETPAVEAAAVAETPMLDTQQPAPLASLDDLRGGPAPEHSRDMSALRDLANQSARTAIGVAETKFNKEQALANLAISGIAMVCGGYLAATAPGMFSSQFFGGLAGFGWAGYWGANTLRHMVAAGRAGADAKPSEQPASTLPIDLDESSEASKSAE